MITKHPSWPQFVHLRVKTSLSILKATIKPNDIAHWATTHNSPAVAITDHDNLHAVLEISETLANAGIQPIPGLTLSIADTANRQIIGSVALLAKNARGYQNLLELSSESWINSAADAQPAVTSNTLKKYANDLICLTGGQSGLLDRPARAGYLDEVKTRLNALHHAFDDRLYVEIQRSSNHNSNEKCLITTACELDLPIVATHDCRFLNPDDHHICQTAVCIGTSTRLSDPDAPVVDANSYLKSPKEMTDLFADLPGALAASVEIAQRCAFRPKGQNAMMPRFCPTNVDERDELAKHAHTGLTKRLENNTLYADEKTYRTRLDHEISIISGMGFAGYFLIVADFVQWARSEEIPVGPGRGSGAGSLVAWSLTITTLDPLRFGLLFERFLNPERVSIPDFDIDFCHEKRNKVIDYARSKYGDHHVASIITFGTLQPRAVLRDVGRVMDVPFMKVDRLAKTIPFVPTNPTTLADELETRGELHSARQEDEQIAQLINVALRLEGHYRNASTHAAGIVIADKPIREIAPLYKDPKSHLAATQFSMKWAEHAGLVKFDFLGLKTLTTIDKTCRFLSERGVTPSSDFADFSDPETYALLSSGNSLGVFQMESPGMRDTLRKMKPDCIEDIIALISLYRPGPMKNIDTFIERKHGTSQPDYLHPDLETLLRETYGVIVYQEQVMEIARILAGYSLGEADLLRRAMGKKRPAEMALQKSRFLTGAAQRSIHAGKAEHIFDLLAEFAGYGFNKSHAAAYAVLCYQTAYLKAHHAPEFMAASMSVDLHNTDKLAQLVAETKRIGLTVLPPDVTRSETDFTVNDNAVLYALGAVKGVGVHAIEPIVRARKQAPFADLADLAQRSGAALTGRKICQALATAGAFDSLEPNRAKAFAAAATLASMASSTRNDSDSGQSALFAQEPHAATQLLPQTPPWNQQDKLAREAQAIGFFLSGHPLDTAFADLHRNGKIISASDVEHGISGNTDRFPMLGMVHSCQRKTSPSSGQTYASLRLSEPSGHFNVYIPPKMLEHIDLSLLQPGTHLHLTVRLGRGDKSLHAVSIKSLTSHKQHSATPEPLTPTHHPVVIRLNHTAPIKELANTLNSTNTPSARTICLDLATGDGRYVRVRLKGTYDCADTTLTALKSTSGVENIRESADQIA